GTAAAGQVGPDGAVIRYGAGPALVFSFLLLGGACALAALTAGILAAPDVRQLDLVPAATGRGASARMLWSRSRGSVLSGTRLPQVGTDRVYQLWLHGREVAVSAGLFAPDAEGHASAVFEGPDRLPWPVVGATVTLEPAGGSPRPTGPAVLTTFAADRAAP
ncbi:MAG TPA: anti-sigma factor, partial [Methylomirabilota bacterium]